jgi:hypothetical protein
MCVWVGQEKILKKRGKMSNLLLIFMGILLLVPALIYKQFMLSLTFIIFGLVFGFIEYLSHYYTGHTVTQHFMDLMATNKKEGMLILGCMLLGWTCLLLHLGMKFK